MATLSIKRSGPVFRPTSGWIVPSLIITGCIFLLIGSLRSSLFAQQTISGLANGGIYASLAVALVLIYRATEVINFAQGALATFATYIAWQLIDWGLTYWLAFACTLAISFVGGSLVQVVPRNGSGSELIPQKPFTIVLSYQMNGEFVQGVLPSVRPRSLAVYGLDRTIQLWVKLPSSVDEQNHRVTASVVDGRYTVFALLGQTDTSLADVFAYPVPFRPAKGKYLTFINMAQSATLRLYSVDGRSVRTLRKDDGGPTLPWDGMDDGGAPVGSGVYFYVIESATDKKTGKVMVIR